MAGTVVTDVRAVRGPGARRVSWGLYALLVLVVALGGAAAGATAYDGIGSAGRVQTFADAVAVVVAADGALREEAGEALVLAASRTAATPADGARLAALAAATDARRSDVARLAGAGPGGGWSAGVREALAGSADLDGTLVTARREVVSSRSASFAANHYGQVVAGERVLLDALLRDLDDATDDADVVRPARVLATLRDLVAAAAQERETGSVLLSRPPVVAGDRVTEAGLADYLDTVRRQDAAAAALTGLRPYPAAVDAATGTAGALAEPRDAVRRTAVTLEPSPGTRSANVQRFAEVTGQRLVALDQALAAVAGDLRAAADEAVAQAVRRAGAILAGTAAVAVTAALVARAVTRRRSGRSGVTP
ncbi:hypothetical protein [Kineosporia sp. A_224]|uniref:hypothetical protein n=1 Tax=Kineosporia sp. A_224 TaxID=1962180 RepID=UPI001179AA84|nr:hypothetical protein [Kineosporia sp. A_224]